MTGERTALADELLPCPFCGGKPAFERHGTNRQSCIIACQDCGCRVETGETWNEGIVWNTRAPLPGRLDCGANDDEHGYFELGKAFWEEFHQLDKDGSFKGFICGCSPIEILVHLINERDEAIAPLPPTLNSGADREAIARALCCPGGCVRDHECVALSKRELSPNRQDQIDAILALPRAVQGGAVREALKPFANISLARDTDPTAPDMIEAPDLSITPNDVRRARAALSHPNTGGGK